MSRCCAAATWSIVGLATVLGSWACRTTHSAELNPAIGPAAQERYQSIQDWQNWLNPSLSVCVRDVVLDVRSVGRVGERVPSETVRQILLDLPAAAWPYGRVVSLQLCSFGP